MFSYCNIVQFYTFEHETEEVFENVGGEPYIIEAIWWEQVNLGRGEGVITPLPPSSPDLKYSGLPYC